MWIGQELVVVKVSSDIQNVKGSGPATQGKDLQGIKPRSGTAPMMRLADVNQYRTEKDWTPVTGFILFRRSIQKYKY